MTDLLDRLRVVLADRYTIEQEVGSGGMATVYLAEDVRHHRKVAVKVLRPDLAATLGPERFLREIEVAARLQHPHILPLHDSGEADDFLYYVMPYIEGQSLRERLAREGALPIGDAVRILRDVVDALTEAHANRVVHRDIKPENILLRGHHALVTDFGVAKAVSEATGREELTTAGVALGTPTYMAPEQASADPHVDHRVDLYAVGAVAYEMLTGRPVFMGTTPQMILSAHMAEAPQPVTKHRDTVPVALEAIVMRCLEKQPADRWQSAEELLPQLEALATPSGGVTPTDTRPIAASPTVKSRWLVPTVLGSAVALIVVGFLAAPLLRSKPITVTTSNIRAITSDRVLDLAPALSPDGGQVAFMAMRDGQFTVVLRSTRTTTGARELIPASELGGIGQLFPRWSADGEFVRFTMCGLEGQCSWREVHKLGGSARTVGVTAWDASWSPDDTRIVFRGVPNGDSMFSYSVPDEETTLLAITEDRWGLHSFTWSPSGSHIAYVVGNAPWRESFNVRNSSIWTVSADGGEPVRITSEEYMDVSPAWLDDDHLLFVSNREGPREAYVVAVGPTGPHGAAQKVAGVTDPHSISYSAEGRKLAFAKAQVRQNIWSYPLGGGTLSIADGVPLTSDNAVIEQHDLSPDGMWVAYDQNIDGSMDLYRRSLTDGSVMRLTDLPGDEFRPAWSPDGGEIAFFTPLTGSNNEVMVISVDGGSPVQLTDHPASDAAPNWCLTGLCIAFSSDRSGRNEVWVMSRDSVGGAWGEPRQLTDFGCWTPGPWAPDGSGVPCISHDGAVTLVSLDGEVVWRRALPDVMTSGIQVPHFSTDGATVFVFGSHVDGTEGIWAIPAQGGEPLLIVAFDDPELDVVRYRISVAVDRLYVTVVEPNTDIWVADVEVER